MLLNLAEAGFVEGEPSKQEGVESKSGLVMGESLRIQADCRGTSGFGLGSDDWHDR